MHIPSNQRKHKLKHNLLTNDSVQSFVVNLQHNVTKNSAIAEKPRDVLMQYADPLKQVPHTCYLAEFGRFTYIQGCKHIQREPQNWEVQGLWPLVMGVAADFKKHIPPPHVTLPSVVALR